MSGEALKPNCTQCPNEILDRLLPILSPSQFKLVMAIVRKTYGWHKKSDNISLTQLERMTGMSRQTVIDASTPLRASGFIVIGRSGRRGVLNYSLNINVDTESLVKTLDQSKNLTSLNNTTSLVQILDTQKKLTKENKTGAKAPESFPSRKGRKLTRGAGIPIELQPAVSRVVAKINELAGTHYRDDKPDALHNLLTRLRDGRTEAECLAVVEGRHAAWAGNDKMLEYFRPSTLFAKDHFGDYLQAAQRRGNGHGEGPPKIVKREGDILTLADGSITPAGTYQRKYGISP